MPDFTNLAARRWWLYKRRYLVEDIGIDGFKTDGGEHGWGDAPMLNSARRAKSRPAEHIFAIAEAV